MKSQCQSKAKEGKNEATTPHNAGEKMGVSSSRRRNDRHGQTSINALQMTPDRSITEKSRHSKFVTVALLRHLFKSLQFGVETVEKSINCGRHCGRHCIGFVVFTIFFTIKLDPIEFIFPKWIFKV
jgi:hypothetical protein